MNWRLAFLSSLTLLGFFASRVTAADEPSAVAKLLSHEIIGSQLPMQEVQDYAWSRVPPMPAFDTAAEWQKYADAARQRVLERVVYRGEAAAWRDMKTNVEWLDTIAGGPGYRIKKLRYEVVPGMWVPGLLYEPEKLEGKTPVMMAVNGHDRKGKAADYKQIRCINLAKRGMIVLNLEWFGMGQLLLPGYAHSRLNQLDLCGTSGLAPFYLAMKRGLDILLSQEHADSTRVAVSGLSGGGWQTIIISSLDTRVTLANPVAGYSSFKTRAKEFSDLGDSEQTPVDLGVNADYALLTAMRAPRPTLLTYNAKDQCCFKADHALPPLMEAASPVFKLFGKEQALRSHVNHDPGTHNYEQDNREAFYRMIKDFFYDGSDSFDAKEIPSNDEVKTPEQLEVKLPEKNEDLHTVAKKLAETLPNDAELPNGKAEAQAWRETKRKQLTEILRVKKYPIVGQAAGAEMLDGIQATYWRLKIDDSWTLPAVELSKGKSNGTVIVIADEGRTSVAAEVEKLVADGQRVVAIDPFYFGESKLDAKRAYLFALLMSTIGDRPLGIQASQVAAVGRWAALQFGPRPSLATFGPRSSIIGLAALGVDGSLERIELTQPLGSLKQVLEQDRTFDQSPELFCFGLLEAFDVRQLVEIVGWRKILVHDPSDRAKAEFKGLLILESDAKFRSLFD